MAYLLRKIRKSRWYRAEDVAWLPDNELQADALDDLRTKDNELSVYHIDEDESNLDRVLAALAANADHPSNVDFAIFDQTILSDIGISRKGSRGELPDEQVSNWHSDLYELSASKLLELALTIKATARIERKGYRQILELVAESLAIGRIDPARLKWNKKYLDKVNEIILTKKGLDS